METKSLYTMKDICEFLGVHRNTVMKKMKKYDFLLNKDIRKRHYTENEFTLVKKAFNIL